MMMRHALVRKPLAQRIADNGDTAERRHVGRGDVNVTASTVLGVILQAGLATI